jgi:GrpB-like predicted nucleotidyltransferase (UPF0157 family)
LTPLPVPLDERIRIVASDPRWPVLFEQEQEVLNQRIGRWAVGGIHHIGSTAVPGLAAKPIIDILVGIDDLDAARACFPELAQLSYRYWPYLDQEMHWFCKPHPSRRTHHLQLLPRRSQRFRDELGLRDRLRSDADLADAYALLKKELAQRHRNDRNAYTEGKCDFIRHALGR